MFLYYCVQNLHFDNILQNGTLFVRVVVVVNLTLVSRKGSNDWSTPFSLTPFSRPQVAETRCKKVCTSKSDLRTNDFSIVGSLPRDFELSNFDCYGKPINDAIAHGKSKAKHQKRPPPPKPVIPSAAKRVDLYARALFPFSFLFFNVVYWSVYLWLFSCKTDPTSLPPVRCWSDYLREFQSECVYMLVCWF